MKPRQRTRKANRSREIWQTHASTHPLSALDAPSKRGQHGDYLIPASGSTCLAIPKKDNEKKLNTKREPSHLGEAMVHHTSEAPKLLQVGWTHNVTEEGRKI
jgi:hypothetical protein